MRSMATHGLRDADPDQEATTCNGNEWGGASLLKGAHMPTPPKKKPSRPRPLETLAIIYPNAAGFAARIGSRDAFGVGQRAG